MYGRERARGNDRMPCHASLDHWTNNKSISLPIIYLSATINSVQSIVFMCFSNYHWQVNDITHLIHASSSHSLSPSPPIGFLSSRTDAISYLANSYPSHLVPWYYLLVILARTQVLKWSYVSLASFHVFDISSLTLETFLRVRRVTRNTVITKFCCSVNSQRSNHTQEAELKLKSHPYRVTRIACILYVKRFIQRHTIA